MTNTTNSHSRQSSLWALAYNGCRWLPWLALLLVTGLTTIVVVREIICPAYLDRQSRLYTSRLGYVALRRGRNLPLPVVTGFPQERWVSDHFVGEGFVRSTPILIPIIPASRIECVLVSAGDVVMKGQTLAELDRSKAKLRLEAARVMLEVAEAELERTKIGSSYLLDKERPERDAIRVDAAKQQLAIRDELNQMYEDLVQSQAVSRAEFLTRKLTLVDSLTELRQAQVSLERSQKGRAQSLRIANATVREARLALRQRDIELTEHRIVSPADGIVERRLIQEGEYNQDPGKPAFLLASGRWFEAYLDQTVIGKIHPGDAARISLEAFAGVTLEGTVSSVLPFVSYNSGGPETTRPIRPSGTGSPEWPSTFSMRVELPASELPISTGMSGLARIGRSRQVLAVPNRAFLFRTAAEGIVLVVEGDEFARRTVVLGASSDGWTEIQKGLTANEEVILEGQHDLRPGDQFAVQLGPVTSVASQE